MSTPRAGDKRFLELHGNKWRVVVPVPKAAQPAIGKTKLRHALGTDSLAAANRVKWEVVAQLQRQITLALTPGDQAARALFLAKQRGDVLASGGDPEAEELLIDELIDEVAGPAIGTDNEGLPVHEPARFEAALAVADIAYGRRTPLGASREEYLSQLTVAPRTRADDERAFKELLE